jgi:hypothetical protein
MRGSEDLLDPAHWPKDGETPLTPGWRFASIGFERDPVDIGAGIDPWQVSWVDTRTWIVVAHPSYPTQRHTTHVYEVAGTDPPRVFAAGEFSNGVWGIYVPEEGPAEPPA